MFNNYINGNENKVKIKQSKEEKSNVVIDIIVGIIVTVVGGIILAVIMN